MRRIAPLSIVTVLGVFLLVSNAAAQTKKGANVIKSGPSVSLQYTLTNEKGRVIESNKGKEPMIYTHGSSQIIPGLEKELAGMAVGGEKKIRVKPEEAYGQVDPKAFREIPRANVPPEGLKVGAVLSAKNAQGQSFPVRVHEIKEKTVVMDLNHPLAGKTLSFDVKILDIKAAAAK